MQRLSNPQFEKSAVWSKVKKQINYVFIFKIGFFKKQYHHNAEFWNGIKKLNRNIYVQDFLKKEPWLVRQTFFYFSLYIYTWANTHPYLQVLMCACEINIKEGTAWERHSLWHSVTLKCPLILHSSESTLGHNRTLFLQNGLLSTYSLWIATAEHFHFQFKTLL